MSEVHIVCPTHGRAGDLHVLKVMPDITLVVAKSQVPLYREAHPTSEIVVHPDEVHGLSAKRQWIYEHFGTVFMMDDDVFDFVRMFMQKGESPLRHVRDPEMIKSLIQRGHDIAEDIGAYLWGFNQWPRPLQFHPQEPFEAKGYIGGHAIGIRGGSKLWWPRQGMHGSEDMWICALNAHFHRKIFKDQRYCAYQKETLRAKGGLANDRTMATLAENYDILRKTFGPVIKKKGGTSSRKLIHQFEMTLSLPY